MYLLKGHTRETRQPATCANELRIAIVLNTRTDYDDNADARARARRNSARRVTFMKSGLKFIRRRRKENFITDGALLLSSSITAAFVVEFVKSLKACARARVVDATTMPIGGRETRLIRYTLLIVIYVNRTEISGRKIHVRARVCVCVCKNAEVKMRHLLR